MDERLYEDLELVAAEQESLVKLAQACDIYGSVLAE